MLGSARRKLYRFAQRYKLNKKGEYGNNTHYEVRNRGFRRRQVAPDFSGRKSCGSNNDSVQTKAISSRAPEQTTSTGVKKLIEVAVEEWQRLCT
mmetsp:Transcript_44639/g.66234  ORF Transcript_44639/g.66234 Transcript_44639/m.66234 type:complete len:94 (-) Transcript_44639:229-510(-)